MKDCFIVVGYFGSDIDNVFPIGVFLSRKDAVAYIDGRNSESDLPFFMFIIESNLYENYGC